MNELCESSEDVSVCEVVGSFNTNVETALTIIFFSSLFCFSFLLLSYSSVFPSYLFLFVSSSLDLHIWMFTVCNKEVPSKCSCQYNPYPTAFPYGNGMVLHFYQQQESSTTKTVHKVINKGLKTYV